MKSFLVSLAAICLFGTLIPAILCSASLPFSVDFAQFKYDSTSTAVEVYYSFPDSVISYKAVGKNYVGALNVAIEFRNNVGVAAAWNWSIENKRTALKGDVRNDLFGQKVFQLKPGQYVVSLKVRDENDPKKADSTNINLVVRKFSETKVQLSELELAYKIEYQHSTSREWNNDFKKGEVIVVPEPNLEIRDSTPELNTYLELYNLKKVQADSIRIHYSILDGAKREVFDLLYNRPIAGNSQADIFRAPLDALNSGVYFVKATVIYPEGEKSDSVSAMKKFFLVNPVMPAALTDLYSLDELFLQSEFATMSEQRIDKEFETVKFIITQAESETYTQLTSLTAKQKFMFRFWLERDPDPLTKANERLEQHRKAIDFANKNYESPQIREGWRSDRGRILLKYGFPTQIDRQYFQLNVHPHEIWYYNDVQGGVIFCFVSNRGQNHFRMVHSTAMNELREDNWFKRYAMINEVNPEGQSRKGNIR